MAHAQERTFRTDGGRDTSVASMETIRVSGLTCRIKKITVSDDGKLTMALEGTVTDDESIGNLRDLVMIQQGEVTLSIEGAVAEASGASVQ
jgi:hypothetical protein